MSVMRKLVVVETKLLTRDWGTIVFGLLFPAALLVGLTLVFPGFTDPNPDLGGGRLIDIYTPIMLIFVFAMVGISSLSSNIATYRQDGVLRRLRTTPVGPSRLLLAHLVAQLTIALLGVALAVTVALVALDVPAPTSWPSLVLSVVLAAATVFAIGLLVGAVSSSTSTSQAISTFVWLPVMVLAGLWFPREVMPAGMQRVSDLSPGGAAVDAVQQAWFGTGAPASSLAIMIGFAVVTTIVAARFFRWD